MPKVPEIDFPVFVDITKEPKVYKPKLPREPKPRHRVYSEYQPIMELRREMALVQLQIKELIKKKKELYIVLRRMGAKEKIRPEYFLKPTIPHR